MANDNNNPDATKDSNKGVILGEQNINIGLSLEGLIPAEGAETEEEKKKRLENQTNTIKNDSTKKDSDTDSTLEAKDDTNEAPVGIEIDGIQYSFDKDGNAIDKDGKIIKTKTEVEAIIKEAEVVEEIPLTTELIQKIGVELKDEKGNPIQYEDSIEGMTKMVTDIAEHLNKKERQEFFKTYPEVAEFATHIINGGNSEEFFQKKTESWKNISLKDSSEEFKMDIIVKDLVSKGYERKEAEETAKLYKDSNKLDSSSESALKRLQKEEQGKEIALKEKQIQESKDYEETVVKHWNTVEEVIKKGTLSHIAIPETDKDAFFSYMSKAVDENGQSQAMLDRNTLPLDQKILLDYVVYKKLDFSKLIANKVASKDAMTLRTRLLGKEQSEISGASSRQSIEEKNVKPADFDFSLKNLNLEQSKT